MKKTTSENSVTYSTRPEPPVQLRYAGFDQVAGIRHYKFESAPVVGAARLFRIQVEVALFLKHRIGMQEGPSLCLKKLAEVAIADLADGSEQLLTEADLLVYSSARTALAEQKAASRKSYRPPFRPSAPPVATP